MSRYRALLWPALLVAAGCGGGSSDTAFDNQGAEARYVGGDECRHCHLDIATSYARTGMGRAWHRMGTRPLEADFTDDNTFAPPNQG